MDRNDNNLIESLVDDLTPVRPLRRSEGGLLVLAAVVLTALLVTGIGGIADAVREGTVSPLFLLANGLLLLLGIAASASTIAMANPGVGHRHEGTLWAAAMAGVFPAVALGLLLLRHDEWLHLIDPAGSWHCLASALLASLLTAAALLVWLRRGAPVSPATAGWHLGIGATALGTAVYALACPLDTLFHLGLWHALPVVLGGLAGRLLVPRLLRW